MSPLWTRVVIAAAVIVSAALLAKAIDLRIGRRELDAATATRYRILRRAIFTTIVVVGVLSALLVIPQVRAIAGGILASGAVLGLVIGFAAQRTIGNFIAGILIAFSQPVRLGDEVEIEGGRGVVEEIGLTYTWVRLPDGDRLVVLNERLVAETLRNATIRSATAQLQASQARVESAGAQVNAATAGVGTARAQLAQNRVPLGDTTLKVSASAAAPVYAKHTGLSRSSGPRSSEVM